MQRSTSEVGSRVEPNRGDLSGWVWFALMVIGWILFFALVAVSEPTLGGLRGAVTDLPLLAELLAWFALFPFVLALTIWESSWEEPLRLFLVCCCAVGWTIAFLPWRAVRRRNHLGTHETR